MKRVLPRPRCPLRLVLGRVGWTLAPASVRFGADAPAANVAVRSDRIQPWPFDPRCYVPLSDSFDSKYLNPPGTLVAKIRPPTRITQTGIEHLHIDCPPQPISHSQPHFTALRVSGQDCWVRDVVCDETILGIDHRT